MPTTKSAAKRMRTSAENQLRNRAAKSALATVRRQFLAAADKGDKPAAEKLFRAFVSQLDRAYKHGTIKAGNADRRKSRAAARLALVK
jgi:small subunit ribosomal protein S20